MNQIFYNSLLTRAIKANFGWEPLSVHVKMGKEPLMAKAIYYYKMNANFPGTYTDKKELAIADQYFHLKKNDANFRRKLALVENYLRLMG